MKLTLKYLAALLVTVSLRSSLVFGQALSGEILRLRGTSLPSTCNTGDVRFQTSTSKLKVCIVNSWSEIAMSTASFTANRVLATDNSANIISSQLAIDSSGVIEPLTDLSTDFGSTTKRFSALFAIEVDSGTSDFRITSSRILTSLTANRALVSDATSSVGVSPVTTSELTFVSGVTSQLCGINQTCTFTNKSIDADNNPITNIENADIKALAGIVYSKLNLTASIVNADVSNAAAIAYSKLNLTNSILNTDISSTAAIDYSKLNLTGSVVNADIANAAAIAYSKLNLASSILGSDFSTASGLTVATLRANGASSFGGNVTASGNFIGNVVGNVTGSLTGAASTATAFTSTPTACSSNQYAHAIASNGNLTCAQVDFSQVTGFATIAQGGTNNTTLSVAAGGVIYSDGSKLMNTGAGTAAQVLQSNGASAPSWGTPMKYAGITVSYDGGGVPLTSAQVSSTGSNWVNGLGDNGAGDVTLTIAASYFSATPVCGCTVVNAATANPRACKIYSASSTGVRVIANNLAGADSDEVRSVICIGN